MKRRTPTDPDMTMEDIMRLWPSTIATILQYGMLCVGCPIAGFHTTEDACAEHDVEPGPFLRDLDAAAKSD